MILTYFLCPVLTRRANFFSVFMLAERYSYEATPNLVYISLQAQRISALMTGIAIVHTAGMPWFILSN